MVPFKPETFFKNSRNWDKKQQFVAIQCMQKKMGKAFQAFRESCVKSEWHQHKTGLGYKCEVKNNPVKEELKTSFFACLCLRLKACGYISHYKQNKQWIF